MNIPVPLIDAVADPARMRKAAREQREFVESNNQVTGYDVAFVAASC